MVSGTHRTSVGTMQMPQLQIQETHRPNTVGECKQADVLTRQRIADKSSATFPHDFAVGMNFTDGHGSAITGRLGCGCQSFAPRPVATGRCFLFQRLMGPMVVVIATPALEALLLRRRRWCEWPQGIRFEHPVMLLVSGILFGMTFGGKLHPNAQTPPPDTQPGKSQGTGRTPRHTVVTADDAGLAIMPEQPRKHMPDRFFPLIGPGAHAQYIARKQISHGERMQARALGGAEATFEIHRPDLIGTARRRQRWQRLRRSTPRPWA